MQIVDLDRVRDAGMDDGEFMIELIDIFLGDAPKQLLALRRALDSRSAKSVDAAAHRLRGASGNLGAEGLSMLCRQLETSGRTDSWADVPELLERAEGEFGRVREFFDDFKTERGR